MADEERRAQLWIDPAFGAGRDEECTSGQVEPKGLDYEVTVERAVDAYFTGKSLG